MSLALDSSILIDLLRRRDPGVITRFSDAVLSGLPLMVSAIVIHELEAGLAVSRSPARRRAQLAAVLAQCSVVDFVAGDSETSGRLRAELREAGTPIGELDILIAGQALAQGWTVVTRNIRHFGRVRGLPLIDWGVGSRPLTADELASRVDGA